MNDFNGIHVLNNTELPDLCDQNTLSYRHKALKQSYDQRLKQENIHDYIEELFKTFSIISRNLLKLHGLFSSYLQ